LHAEPETQLILIRHGETQWNLDQRIQGHHDVPLTEKGLEQARLLARHLVDEPLHAVYSSDLSRARQTAEILAAGRSDIRFDPRLREAGMGRFEGHTPKELRERYPEAFEAWRRDSVRNRPLGGETLEDLQERCLAALRDLLPRHPGQTVAVVTHGGPVRVMVCGALGVSLEVYPKLRVENTAVARILFTERGPILAGMNDVAHLRATAVMPRHSGWEEK
jgi:probable phosphoglycerate mutase